MALFDFEGVDHMSETLPAGPHGRCRALTASLHQAIIAETLLLQSQIEHGLPVKARARILGADGDWHVPIPDRDHYGLNVNYAMRLKLAREFVFVDHNPDLDCVYAYGMGRTCDAGLGVYIETWTEAQAYIPSDELVAVLRSWIPAVISEIPAEDLEIAETAFGPGGFLELTLVGPRRHHSIARA